MAGIKQKATIGVLLSVFTYHINEGYSFKFFFTITVWAISPITSFWHSFNSVHLLYIIRYITIFITNNLDAYYFYIFSHLLSNPLYIRGWVKYKQNLLYILKLFIGKYKKTFWFIFLHSFLQEKTFIPARIKVSYSSIVKYWFRKKPIAHNLLHSCNIFE